MEPSGFLSLKVTPQSGDKLILYPVYICPVEILERGVMIRPSYYRAAVIIGAFNRRTMLLKEEDVAVCEQFVLSTFEVSRLDVKVTPEQAGELAEYGGAPDACRSWRGMIYSRRVSVNTDKIRLVWHIYAVNGGEVTDTFTGEKAQASGLVDTLFS